MRLFVTVAGCLALGALLGCARSLPAVAGATAGTTTGHVDGKPPRLKGGPHVVLVAGGAPCDVRDETSDIEPSVRADMQLLEATLLAPDANLTRVEHPDPASVREALLSRDNKNGLVVFYSGHGYVSEEQQSVLCMPGAEADRGVTALLESFLARAKGSALPPWIFVVLNACESAYVDVSRMTVPTSVLAASRYDVNVHQPLAAACVPPDATTPAPAPRDRATSLAILLATILRNPVDSNCDGVFSDQELLEALRAELARCIGFPENAPWPTLRRQASSSLPLFALRDNAACQPRQQEYARLAPLVAQHAAELAAALPPRDGRTNALPQTPDRDYFVFSSPVAHQACWNRFSGTATSGEQTDRLVEELCDPAANLPLRPLPAPLAGEARTLAALLTSADIYELRPNGTWVDIVDLGKQRLVSTVTANNAPRALPRRSEIAARWPQRGQLLAYFRRGVPRQCADDPQASDGLCAQLCTRKFVPCPGGEGQCFVLDPNLSNVCKEP